MTTQQKWIAHTAWEGTSLKVMARIVGKDNQVVTQSDVASVSYRVVESGDTEIASSASLTVSEVIFDSLQTPDDDPAWTKDSTGYNFMTILPPSVLPNGGKTVYIPFTFTDNTSPTAVVSILGVKVSVNETYADTPA